MVNYLISHAYGCRSPKKRLMLQRRNKPTKSFEYRLCCLVITFFMQGDFSAKLQQMSFLSQSTVSNPGPQPRTKGRVLIRKAHQKSKTHCLMVSHLISHAYGCRSPKKRLMLERRNMPTKSFEYRL